MMNCITRMLLVTAAAGHIVIAQTQTSAAPAFEEASIKPSAPGGRGAGFRMSPGGRFNTTNVSVKMLMTYAFNVRDFQITGGPSWINSERYDIVAKPEGEGQPTQDQMRLMVQALLADRFKLAFHRETKELPTYALVVAKNGPRLTENTDGQGQGGKPVQVRMGRGQISGQKVSMAMLANQIGQQLGRSVVDKTGLKGDYDVKLEWTPDENEMRGPGDGPGERVPETAPTTDPSGPSIFTAVQEQLGLKLEAQKGPVDIILIDHIEKASEN